MATDRLINKDQGDDIIDALSDIATNINTITYGPQTSADKVVSMTGYAKAGTADAISQGDTLNEAVGKLEKKADDNATAIDGKTAGPESATVGDIATFNNVSGKVLNDSGVAIATSVDDTKDTEVPTSKAVGTYVSGKGYATGVATSTANHLVTFNGTDGKALKDGGATIAFDATGVQNDDTAIPTSKAVQSYVTGKHYAGSSSDGGAATSADKLNIGNSNIGSATQPVYFDKTTGKPVAITNTIQSNVPANAVFTDTTYTVAEGTQNGKIKVTPSVGSAYEVPVHGLGNAAYKGVADTVSTSTDLVTSNAVNTKLASYVPNSDFVEVVDNGVKNLLHFEGSNTVIGNFGGFLINGLNAITVFGKAAWAKSVTSVPLSPDTYELIFTIDSTDVNMSIDIHNESNNTNYYHEAFTATGTIAREFTIPSGVSPNVITFRVCCNNSSTAQTDTVTSKISNVMICTKGQFNISSAYEPYALGNQVLTPELIELVDSGAKNVLEVTSSNISSTNTNVTTTLNSDKSITITRTGTVGALVLVYIPVYLEANKTYVISGCASGGTYETYSVDLRDTNNTPVSGTGSDYGSGVTITIPTSGTYRWCARFDGSYTIPTTGLTFKPMICTKAAFSVSPKFVPYRPNYDLVVSRLNEAYGHPSNDNLTDAIAANLPQGIVTGWATALAGYTDRWCVIRTYYLHATMDRRIQIVEAYITSDKWQKMRYYNGTSWSEWVSNT